MNIFINSKWTRYCVYCLPLFKSNFFFVCAIRKSLLYWKKKMKSFFAVSGCISVNMRSTYSSCALFPALWKQTTWVATKCTNYYYYFTNLKVFFTPALADGFPRESEWQQVPQVSRTLLSILTDLNNALVKIISTRPLISKSSSPYTSSSVTVPSVSITIAINVNFVLHNYYY